MPTYDYINFSCTLSSVYGTPGIYASLADCENAVSDGSVEPVLILNPLWSASKKASLPLLTNKLGDGYQQTVFQGIDKINEEWSITSPILIGSEVNDLLNQLRSFCTISFFWSPNNGVIDYQEFVCDEWQKIRVGVNEYQLATTFRKIGNRKDRFLNLLIPSYTIGCPPSTGFKLIGCIDSNATQFEWEQIAGNRTVLFDSNTIKEPTIFIQSTCYTTGCDSGTGLPIVLRVKLPSNPNIFKDLIIYNTLTSISLGNSASKGILSDRACQRVTPIPYISPLTPSFLQKAYCENVDSTFFITWLPPSCDSEFVTGYSLVVNTTGSYVEIDSVTANEEKLFEVELNKHYRIVTHFNIYGKVISAPSNIFYYVVNDVANFITHLAYGDDSYNGISAGKLTSNYSKVDLKVTVDEYIDNYQGISSNKLTSNYSKVDLKVSVYEYEDECSGISASKLTSNYAKVNLGGVVIG